MVGDGLGLGLGQASHANPGSHRGPQRSSRVQGRRAVWGFGCPLG
jgi:hypothetical protein